MFEHSIFLVSFFCVLKVKFQIKVLQQQHFNSDELVAISLVVSLFVNEANNEHKDDERILYDFVDDLTELLADSFVDLKLYVNLYLFHEFQ